MSVAGDVDSLELMPDFNVEAVLRFTFPLGHPVAPEDLRAAVFTVVSKIGLGLKYADGSDAPSAMPMPSPNRHNGNGVDQLWEVSFRPPFLLRGLQVGCYWTLIEEAAKRVDSRKLGAIGLMYRINLLGVGRHVRVK